MPVKTEPRLLQALRSAVRGLWSGVYTLNEFAVAMLDALDGGFYRAFKRGFGEFGISPDEWTPSEKAELYQMLADQALYVEAFGQWILENSKANGGKLRDVLARVDLWANRYNEAYNRARILAARDGHLMWVLGQAEHCSSCLKLAGKVKRGSVWLEAGIQPQSHLLECGGYRCQCSLVPTDLPATRGPLPRLP